jgi:thiosulfate dehydrogenase [quinone] large subunit
MQTATITRGKDMDGDSGAGVRPGMAAWRLHGIGVLRIIFGVVWAIDAWFKWQPAFIDNYVSYVTGALDGQPGVVKGYIHFWHRVIAIDPRVFAYATAVAETAIALALILGAFTTLTAVAGMAISTVIWSTAEGFGGPYKAGSTDIGAAIMYALIFAGLFLAQAGLYLGVDRRLTPTLGRWGFLASGALPALVTARDRPRRGVASPGGAR